MADVFHKPDSAKIRCVNIFALPCGGFEVRDPFYGRQDEDKLINTNGDWNRNPAIAAFSTLDEALAWLGQNMARPATDPKS